jgi:hypothetical protein
MKKKKQRYLINTRNPEQLRNNINRALNILQRERNRLLKVFMGEIQDTKTREEKLKLENALGSVDD